MITTTPLHIFDTSKMPQQRAFMESIVKELLYSGSFGAGKSRVGCEKGLFLTLKYPRNKGLVLRKTFASLRTTTLDTFQRYVCPPEYIISFNQDTQIMKFANGSEILWAGLDHPEKIASFEAGWIFLDEAIEFTEDDYTMLLGRLRLNTVPFRQLFMATNPASGQHFLYRKFYLEKDPDRQVIEANSLSNPYNPQDYIDTLMKFKGRYKDRYVLGKWVGYEGLVYDIVDPQEVLIPPFDIPSHWDRWGSIDFGYCVDEETEILTKEGWKTHHSLQEGDIALTLNPVGLSEWELVTKVSRFEGPRDMISMEGTAHSSLTTPNHRWLVWPRNQDCIFKTTEELVTGDAIPRAALCINLPSIPTYTDTFVGLVAWLWTEGNHQKNGAYAMWQSETVNPENCREIEEALVGEFGARKESLRYGSRWYSNPEGWWTSYQRPPSDSHYGTIQYQLNLTASQRFDGILGLDKVVNPDFISLLTKEQLNLFLQVSLKGDGSQNHGRNGLIGSRVIGQKIKGRLDSFQIVCSLLGLATTLRPIREGLEWNLTIFKTHRFCLPVDASRAGGKFTITRTSYDGTVWCPTTPNGTWLARRKGTTYFTGNTNPFVFQWWTKVPKEEETDTLRGYYMYREIYISHHTIERIAPKIKYYQDPVEIIFSDHDAEDRATLEEKGILTDLADKAIGPGIQTVFELFGEKLIHFFEHTLDEVDDYLFEKNHPTCTVEELANYRWSDSKLTANAKEIPIDKDNHGMDAMRYFFHTLLSSPVTTSPMTKKDPTRRAIVRNWGSELSQRNWKQT